MKTIKAVFDGKSFVPADVAGIAVGTEVQIVVDSPLPDDGRTAGQRLIDAVGGTITWEEGEAWLKELYADKQADIDLQLRKQARE